MNAATLTLLRYIVSSGCTYMVAKGYKVFNLDSDTLDAVVQIVFGLIAALMALIGMWTSTVGRMVERLKSHHAPTLVAAATQVVTEQPALATRQVTVP